MIIPNIWESRKGMKMFQTTTQMMLHSPLPMPRKYPWGAGAACLGVGAAVATAEDAITRWPQSAKARQVAGGLGRLGPKVWHTNQGYALIKTYGQKKKLEYKCFVGFTWFHFNRLVLCSG